MEDFDIAHCHHHDLFILAIIVATITKWIWSQKYFSKAHWLSLPDAVKWLVFFSVKEWIFIQKIIIFSLMTQNILKLLTSKNQRHQNHMLQSTEDGNSRCDRVQSLHLNLSLERWRVWFCLLELHRFFLDLHFSCIYFVTWKGANCKDR